MPFGFIAPKTFNYLTFQSFDLSVPDEGYSRNASGPLILISTFLLQKIIEKPEFQANLLKWDKKDNTLLIEILKFPYFTRCVYLSWLMAVQNPPMYMDEGPDRRSYIKREMYQEFTKKGSFIDYCV